MYGDIDQVTNVVIVGAPRSGTTLLSGLLSSGDDSFPMLPECTYITQLIRHFYDIVNYSDAQRFAAYAINESTLQTAYGRIVRDILSTARSHFAGMPYRYLILKDPELTLMADLIPKFFGDGCKIVCVVRDPRAVIASMLKVLRKSRGTALEHFWYGPSWRGVAGVVQNLLQEKQVISSMFNYYYLSHNSEVFKQQKLHVVKFEKIVARDTGEFERLEMFLGFKIGRNGFEKTHFGFDETDPTNSRGYGKDIQNPASDFRKTLGRRRVAKIESVFSGFNAIYNWW